MTNNHQLRALLREIENYLDRVGEFDPTYLPGTRPTNTPAELLLRLRAALAEPVSGGVVLPEQLIAAIESEQNRLSAEDYLMDSEDCVKVLRETVAALNGGAVAECCPTCGADVVQVPRELRAVNCWSCRCEILVADIREADGNCPRCEAEIDLVPFYEKQIAQLRALLATSQGDGGEA